MSTERNIGTLMLLGFGGLFLYLLGHAKSAMGATPKVSTFLSTPDPATGCPQFNSNVASSIPPGQPIAPINDPVTGAIITVAPAGYTLWKDVASGNYFYFQNVVIGTKEVNAAPNYVS